MAFRVVAGNAWQNVTDARIVVGGAWQRPTSMRAVVGGAWENVWDYDVTGPGPVTGLSAEWNNTGTDKAVVAWTQPSDTDFSYTHLEVNRAGSSSGPWTSLGNFTAARSQPASHNDTSVSFFSYPGHNPINQATYTHYYRLTPYDALGNPGTISIVGTTGQNSTVVRGMLSSPFYVNPNNSRTWRTSGTWRSDSQVVDSTGAAERVIQGWGDPYQNYGHFWYDNKRTGLNPTSSSIWLARTDSGVNSSTPYICLSQAPSSLVGAGTSPTGYTRTSPTLGTTLTNSVQPTPVTSAFHAISDTWVTHLMDGTTWKSMLMYTGETTEYLTTGVSRHYLVFWSANEGGFGIVGGTLRVYHTG